MKNNKVPYSANIYIKRLCDNYLHDDIDLTSCEIRLIMYSIIDLYT